MRDGLHITALLLLIAVASSLSGQEIESLAGVRLTFDRTGARSLAMGSTIAASDDASSVSSNPASLAGARRSASIEGQWRTSEARYFSDESLHTIGMKSSISNIRGASLTVPTRYGTWSFFTDTPIDVNQSNARIFSTNAAGLLFLCKGRAAANPCPETPLFVHFPVTEPIHASLRLNRYGTAVALPIGPLAVGVSLRYENLRQRTAFISVPGQYSLYRGTAESTADGALTYAVGAIYKLSDIARAGVAYASGGAFEGTRSLSNGATRSIEFRAPPSLTAGVAFNPQRQVTLSADAVRVDYSSMMHDRRALFPSGSDLGYVDVTEWHAGAEYRIGAVALRAGWWIDPAHGLSLLKGVGVSAPFELTAALVNSDESHVTAGIGFGTKTRFDASIDHGSVSTRVSLAMKSTF